MPVASDVRLGPGVVLTHPELTNLYGCSIGAGTLGDPFVEIQSAVTIGELCKIESHSFICSGVTIEDGVFVGHGVMFVNDRQPRGVNAAQRLDPLSRSLGFDRFNSRYLVKYGHPQAGWWRRLDNELLFQAARAGFWLFGVGLLGRWGNKLAFVAERSDPAVASKSAG